MREPFFDDRSAIDWSVRANDLGPAGLAVVTAVQAGVTGDAAHRRDEAAIRHGLESALEGWDTAASVVEELAIPLLDGDFRSDARSRLLALAAMDITLAISVAMLAPLDDLDTPGRDADEIWTQVTAQADDEQIRLLRSTVFPLSWLVERGTRADPVWSIHGAAPGSAPTAGWAEGVECTDAIIDNGVDQLMAVGGALVHGFVALIGPVFKQITADRIDGLIDFVRQKVGWFRRRALDLLHRGVERLRRALGTLAVEGATAAVSKAMEAIRDKIIASVVTPVLAAALSVDHVLDEGGRSFAALGSSPQRVAAAALANLPKDHEKWVGWIKRAAEFLPAVSSFDLAGIPLGTLAAAVLAIFAVAVSADFLDSPGPWPDLADGVVKTVHP